MSSGALSSAAREDGGTQQPVPNRAQSGRRGRGSSRRAASYRSTAALQHLQQRVHMGMNQDMVRQRYNEFRSTASGNIYVGNTNNNNNQNNDQHLGDDELQMHMDEFQGIYSEHSETLRNSHHEAIRDRYNKLHVPRIGSIPSPKPHGVFRWMYCQVNGLASAAIRNRKIYDTWKLAEEFDVDGIAFVEVGINWRMFKASGRLASWFEPLADREIRSTESFNLCWPAVATSQPGGTALLIRNGLVEYGRTTAHDGRNLGRWASWVFYTNPDHRTRVVSAYCPGKRKTGGPHTVFTQHITAINSLGLDTTPYALFVSDLTSALRCWRAAGDRIILFIDSNEHVLRGLLAQRLAHLSIDMQESSSRFWPPNQEHNTHSMGTQPIDGIYTTPDIDVNNFLSLSFHEGVGDHRTSIVDFSTASFLGTYQGHIVRPTSRRLTTKQPQSVHNYNTALLSNFTAHRIPERLQRIATDAENNPGDRELLERSENLFEEIKQYRLGSERNCRNILKPYSPFSLPVKYWYDRIHTLRDLIKLKEGKHHRMGKSRILRRATRLHIPTPAQLSIDDCKEGISLSLIQQREVRKQDEAHRSQYLGNCLQAAMESGNEERVQKAKARIRNESSRKMWRRINRVTKPATGRACMQVEVERKGEVFSFTAKDDIEQEIQSECQQRFHLGHSAPISRSWFGEELNYFANDSIAEQLISGTYPIPDDMDNPTALMISEIGRMGRIIRATGDRETVSVSATDYQTYFHRINENTSSSPSGLHLGHDKAAAQCDKLSEILALHMSTIVHTGIHPSRWGVALQVMIEKIAGVCLVTKLRSIQLYEADYNWFNKFIFNDGALRALQSSGLLPEEHYSQRNSTAEDACFDKTLTLDISRQSRTPMAIISVDAAQCYDRVNHRMMALVWLALQVPIQAVAIIVHCLQYMKIFTRTGWGDSTRHFGGNTSDTPFCGLGQGSKAAPASWIQLSSVIVNVYKSMGFGARIIDPVNGSASHTIGCLFVDDTDLYCMDENLSTIPQIAATASIQTSWWARLLNSTGGAIKGPKSFWYLLYYSCKDGIWDYADTKETIEIPLPQDESTTLTSKHPSHAEKTLGVLTSPCGGHAAHLVAMQDKATGWLRSILNGHLPASHTWASYQHQLLPRLQYALGTLTNDLASAEKCLQSMEFKLLPHLGVNRHIKRGWRRTHQTFGGIGLLNLPIEQVICRINIFMQHYDTPSSLGHKLSASLHWLQLQVGCLGSPLLLPYATWEHLSPICWAKCFWQSLDKFAVDLRVQYKSLPLQREGDMSVMEFLLPHMPSQRIMAAMNRCRCYLRILFLSDITSLDGTSISSDMVWGNRPRLSSSLRFPPEQPTRNDWKIWSDVWIQATLPGLGLPTPLGRWITTPHYQWPWRLDNTGQEIHVTSDGEPFMVYARQSSTVRTRSTRLF